MIQNSQVPWLKSGTVGIVGGGVSDLPASLPAELEGVEIRADLLLESGETIERILEMMASVENRGLRTVFTVRIAQHGGVFNGPERDRLDIYRKALQTSGGRSIVVDAEWGTEVARALHEEGAPLILSHHDFENMMSGADLARLTSDIEAWNPWAVKIVPTASRLVDSARMLEWVADARDDGPRRIGFAMGAAGVVSRILAIAHGAPITYASFGAQVAPGQFGLSELLEIYRPGQLDRNTRLFGVAGDQALGSFSPFLHNPAFARHDINAVYLPLQVQSFAELTEFADAMRVEGLSITIPFKEDAYNAADVADTRSQACRASNTILYRRSPAGEMTVETYNTDYDGVLVPLTTRIGSLRGVPVGVIGNGGAARGAVMALKESDASPTLYFRNAERGSPVAAELGIPGHTLAEIEEQRQRVYINATPIGGEPGDPSPVPDSLLTATSGEEPRVAFDMVYQPSRTAFLERAEACEALQIEGREMLIAQGTTQFKHFSGESVGLEEFGEYYRRGQELRAGVT